MPPDADLPFSLDTTTPCALCQAPARWDDPHAGWLGSHDGIGSADWICGRCFCQIARGDAPPTDLWWLPDAWTWQ